MVRVTSLIAACSVLAFGVLAPEAVAQTDTTATTAAPLPVTETTPAPAPEPAPKPKPRIVAPLPTNRPAPPSVPAPQLVSLSNERTLSRWAGPERRAKIFSRHSKLSRGMGRLRMYTEDGFNEVYLLLAEYVDSKRRIWVKVRIPGRPNGRTGWVLRSSLGPYRQNTHLLIINRKTFKATLKRRGKTIWQASVGIGKAGTITPRGHFYVREKFRFKNAPAYGTRAIGTSAYAPTLSDWPGGGVIGIHGTNQPGLLPGRVSHGCVRIRNGAVAKLYRLIPIGTPIWIRG